MDDFYPHRIPRSGTTTLRHQTRNIALDFPRGPLPHQTGPSLDYESERIFWINGHKYIFD